MAGLPSQLNFYDIALVLSPPILAVALMLPAMEQVFECVTRVPDSKIYGFFQDMGAFPAIVAALMMFVLIYSSGQLLLAATDVIRYKVTRKIFEIKIGKFSLCKKQDPFKKKYEASSVKSEFDRRLAALGLEIDKTRDKVWAAAGFLQQRGAYSYADRFNTLAIYSFSLSTIAFVAGITSLVVFVYPFSWYGLSWSIGLIVISVAAYRRAMLFHMFFTSTVMTGFVAVPVEEFEARQL